MLTLQDLGVVEVGRKPEVVVNPEKAREWLKTRNEANRKRSTVLISLYADLMRRNALSYVGEISFDTDNRLIDGQHRLYAVIESNRPQRFSLNLNCPPEAQRDIDTGKLRSTKDTLDMCGATDTAQMASTLMLYKDWTDNSLTKYAVNYGGWGRSRLSRSDKNAYVADMYEQHTDLINTCISLARKTIQRNCGAVLNKSSVGAAALGASDINRLGEFVQFITDVAEGTGLVQGSAQHTMAGSLQKLALRHPRERGKIQILALIIYFFNRRSKTVKTKKFRFNEIEGIK